MLYSVIYIKPLKPDSIRELSQEVRRSFNTSPEVILTNPSSLFPDDIQETEYIFVGQYPPQLTEIINRIENDRSFVSITSAEHEKLDTQFGYKVREQWKPFLQRALSHRRSIQLVPFQILPDDTFQIVLNILTSVLPSTTFEQLFPFVQKSNESLQSVANDSIQHTFLQAITYYQSKVHHNGQRVAMESIQPTVADVETVLRFFMVQSPESLLTQEDRRSTSFNYVEMREFLSRDEVLRQLRNSYRYVALTHTWHIHHRHIPYLSLPSPLLYISDDTAWSKESVRDPQYEFRLDQKGYVSLLRDLMADNNTLYVYSVSDFGKNVYANEALEPIFLQKFFPQWSTKKQPKLSKEEVGALNEGLSTYNSVSTAIYRGIHNKTQDVNKEAELVRFHNFQFQYIELRWKLFMESDQYDTTCFFNEYPLSVDYPFIALRSRSRKENIYKIFKEVFQVPSADIEPTISKREMERWFQYTNYVYDGRKIKESREGIRGVHCKIFWHMGRLEAFERTGIIQTINKSIQRCSILYNKRYYQDVPLDSTFIIVKDDKTFDSLRAGDSVQFYIPQRKFIDIDLTEDATLLVRAPIFETPNQKKKVSDITGEVVELAKKWMRTALATTPNPPCMTMWLDNTSAMQNQLQLKYNERWMYPIQNTLQLTDFVFHIDITVPKKYEIIYDKFIAVLKQFYSYFVVDESIIAVESSAEYFELDSEKWIPVTVESYDIDTDSYTVIDKDIRKRQIHKNVRRNYLRQPKGQDEMTTIIHMTYRRVSDFSLLSPVQQIIVRMEQIKASEDEIIEEIAGYFSLSIEKATQVYNANRNESKIAYMKRETGTDIQFQYVSPVESGNLNIYKFYIQNAHSTGELIVLKRLLMFMMNVYIAYAYPSAKLPSHIAHAIEPIRSLWKKTPTEKKAEDTPVIMMGVSIEQIGKQVQKRFDELDEDIDLEALLEGDEEVEEAIVDETASSLLDGMEAEAVGKEREVHEAHDDGDVVEEIEIQEEALKQKKLSSKKELVSDILERLYQIDGDLFRWESSSDIAAAKKTRVNYAKTCQSIDRQPKILTDEEKAEIDKRYGQSYYPEDATDVCDLSDPAFRRKVEEARKSLKKKPSKKRKSKKGDDEDDDDDGALRCAALKWGSTKEKQNWYICPLVFDTKDNVPVPIKDLDFGKPGFQPMTPEEFPSDPKNAWRTDRTTKKDILEFNPTYKKHTPLTSDNVKRAKENDKLFISNTKKLRKNYVYPGLLDSKKHSKGLFSPCCFENTSSRVMQAYAGIESTSATKITEYILQWGKPLEPGRYGYLPDTLTSRLGLSNLCQKKTSTDCVLRISMRYDSYSFIRTMAYICGYYRKPNVSIQEDKEIIDQFLSSVIRNLTNDTFIRLNRGQLHNQFTVDSNVSPLQNYIEYLIADTPHKVEHLIDLLTRPGILKKKHEEDDDDDDDSLFKDGVRLLIIEYSYEKGEYNYRLLVPYYRSVRDYDDIDPHYVVVLKQFDKEYYEILEYEGMVFADQWTEVNMSKINRYINNVEGLINNSAHPLEQTTIPITMEWKRLLQDARKNNSIFFLDDAKSALSVCGDDQTKCVYDGQKTVGVYSPKYKCMIPVFPVELSSELSVCPKEERIGLLTLYEKSAEMLVDYNAYWTAIKEVIEKAEGKKRIEVRYMYRVPQQLNKEMPVSGFMCHYGVYVPVKNTNYSDIKDATQWKTDAFITDREIRETVKQTYQHNFYGVSNSASVLSQYIEDGLIDVKSVVVYGKNIIGIVVKPGVFIPLRNPYGKNKDGIPRASAKWLDDYPEEILTDDAKGQWSPQDAERLDSYLEKVEELYQKLQPHTSYDPLYFHPVRMDSITMKKGGISITGFILQNGENVQFGKNNWITSSKITTSGIDVMRQFYQRPTIHKLLMERWVVVDSNRIWYNTDRRILANRQFQYQQELYEKIMKRLNRLLKEPEQAPILQWMIEFIENDAISMERKLRLFRPVYVGLMQLCIRFNDETKVAKPEVIHSGINYIWSIYFNTWGMNATPKKVWEEQFGWEQWDEMGSIDRIKKLYKNYTEHFKSQFDKIANSDKIIIKRILEFYPRWAELWNNRPDADKYLKDTQIVVNVRDIQKEVVMEKIFHDIIQNRTRRQMVLYEYTESSTLDEFRHRPETEVIIYEYDQWLIQLSNLYRAITRTYYNQLRTLNEIEYDSKMSIEFSEGERLKKKNLYKTK
jgi:hypothetical protein